MDYPIFCHNWFITYYSCDLMDYPIFWSNGLSIFFVIIGSSHIVLGPWAMAIPGSINYCQLLILFFGGETTSPLVPLFVGARIQRRSLTGRPKMCMWGSLIPIIMTWCTTRRSAAPALSPHVMARHAARRPIIPALLPCAEVMSTARKSTAPDQLPRIVARCARIFV
jgi:hypothetical protein